MGFDKEELAGNLRALRAKKGVLQADVAQAVGVDKSSIANYEQAKSSMSFETAWRLADYYGVPLAAIGGRDESALQPATHAGLLGSDAR